MNDPATTRVGILGAGQLALMLAEAGKNLGIDVVCAGQPEDCAAQAAPVEAVDLTSPEEVAIFAQNVDLVTIESENISASVLLGLNLFPNAGAIGIAQDRLIEKRFFVECGIQVAPFAKVSSLEDLHRAITSTGLPAILKTRRMGYDGKGQVRLHQRAEAAEAWSAVGEVPCILEGMVAFQAEVSLIAARNRTGEIVSYLLIQNDHREGILRRSSVPYVNPDLHIDLQPIAEAYMKFVLEKLDYVGVLAIEFFVVDGQLVANEMAPRVHNSGHWTIEGSQTSQFENHLRAITGMPLGSTQSSPTVMMNCIGEMPALAETRQFPQIVRHDYGKEPRPGRKVGHLTIPAKEHAAIEAWQTRLK